MSGTERGQITVGAIRERHQAHDRGKFAVTIGEAPGDRAVAAGDNRRRSRQGHPGFIEDIVRTSLNQPGAIPNVGNTKAQMHVVGDDRAAIVGARSCNRPVVAAHEIQMPEHLVRRQHGQILQGAQIDFRDERHSRFGGKAAVDGGVPFRRARFQELRQRFGQRRPQQSALQLKMSVRVLQLQIHRVHAQHDVFGGPGLRLGAQYPILEWPPAQGGETGVDSFDIGIDQRAVLRIELRDRYARDFAESMHAQLAVDVDQSRPEQRR